MKRLLEAVLMGSVALLPAAVFALPADDYPTATWSQPFQALPVRGDGIGAPEPVPLANDLQQADVTLPFKVTFNGQETNQIRIGAKGYVTFGVNATNTPSSATSNRPELLNQNNSNEPKNLAAAWWGDHTCDTTAGGIQTQAAGVAADPANGVLSSMRFVIQWDCSKKVANAPSNTGFRAQLILYEAPPGENSVIRAAYGTAIIGSGDWTTVSWGLRFDANGMMGPLKTGVEGCSPTGASGFPRCTGAAHFPTDTVIQYGRGVDPDLTGSVTLDPLTGFSVYPNWVELDLQTTIRNVGRTPAPNVGYDVYLSDSPILDPLGAYKVGSHTPPFFVPSDGQVSLTDSLVSSVRPPNAEYYVCIDIDPNNLVNESDENNNRVCADAKKRVTIGRDLTGTITAPAVGEANATVTIPITIKNKGTEDANGVEYIISMVPDDITNFYEEDVISGQLDEPLGINEVKNFDLVARLPSVIRAEKYQFKMVILPLVGDANRFDNTVLSANWMLNRKPKVVLSDVTLTLPYGCFYGQPMSARYKLCNTGLADAKGFRTGVAMGDQNSPSLNDDPGTVTMPQYCGDLDDAESYNRQYCLPVNGVMPECHYEYCIIPCNPQDDSFCSTIGMECLYDQSWVDDVRSPDPLYSCQLSIAKPPPTSQCVWVTASGMIPRSNRRKQLYEPGPQRFHVIDDIDMLLSEDAPAVISTEPYDCYESLADFTPSNFTIASRVMAGEPVMVDRSIKNIGFTELPEGAIKPPDMVSVEYGYYLSRSKDDISVNQIHAKVKSTNGYGVATVGGISNGFRNEDRRPELIVIPPNIEPGTYYIGLIVDPRNQYRELAKENNLFVREQPIVIGPPALQIVSDGPPVTVVNSKVTYQFVSMGGIGLCRWSAEPLPPGLSMSLNGILEGNPTEIGEFFFNVRVSCGDLSASRAYILRVVESLGSLEVITTSLPPARYGLAYGQWFDDIENEPHQGVQLAASGGKPPYTWDYLEDRAPTGIVLTEHGVLQGSPTTNSQSRSFIVQVTDFDGNKATKPLRIEVLESQSPYFTRDKFDSGMTSTKYEDCIPVSGGANTQNFDFLVEGVPAGLTAEHNPRSLCLTGFPTKAGNYRVRITATDTAGQSISAYFPLTIETYEIKVNNRSLRAVSRGEVVNIQLTTNGTGKVDFSLISGSLPDGLSLSKDGVIAGTVSKDATFGAYNFSTWIHDETGRGGETPLTLAVIVEKREQIVEVKKEPNGCSSTGSMDLSLFGLALAGLAAFRRRGEGR